MMYKLLFLFDKVVDLSIEMHHVALENSTLEEDSLTSWNPWNEFNHNFIVSCIVIYTNMFGSYYLSICILLYIFIYNTKVGW